MFRRLWRAWRHFHDVDASYCAGGIAFYLLFALTPFLLLSLSVAALVSKDSAAFLAVFDRFFQGNVPQYAGELRETMLQVFANRGRIGVIGLVLMFMSARKLVNAIEIGLNRVLELERPKSGMLTTVASFAFIVFAALLFLTTVVATVALDFAAGLRVSFLPNSAITLVGSFLSGLFAAVMSSALFFAIYRFAPARGMPRDRALVAAVSATLLWQGSRHVFVWYAGTQLAQYRWLYGSMASFLLLLLWAYVFGVALLMGPCLAIKK